MCIGNDFLSKKDYFLFSRASRVTDPDQDKLSFHRVIGLLEKIRLWDLEHLNNTV